MQRDRQRRGRDAERQAEERQRGRETDREEAERQRGRKAKIARNSRLPWPQVPPGLPGLQSEDLYPPKQTTKPQRACEHRIEQKLKLKKKSFPALVIDPYLSFTTAHLLIFLLPVKRAPCVSADGLHGCEPQCIRRSEDNHGAGSPPPPLYDPIKHRSTSSHSKCLYPSQKTFSFFVF